MGTTLRNLANIFPNRLVIGVNKIESWMSLGFNVTPSGLIHLGEMTLVLQEGQRSSIMGWDFANLPESVLSLCDVPIIRSLDTETTKEEGRKDHAFSSHKNGVVGIDHIVLRTSNGEFVKSELQSVGIPLKREMWDDAKGMTYMFYRPSNTIIEVLASSNTHDAGMTSSLWGITFTCLDIDKTHTHLSESTKKPWSAKQLGRRITTLDGARHDISIPIAFISPHVSSKRH
jgi:hypothetical protein